MSCGPRRMTFAALALSYLLHVHPAAAKRSAGRSARCSSTTTLRRRCMVPWVIHLTYPKRAIYSLVRPCPVFLGRRSEALLEVEGRPTSGLREGQSDVLSLSSWHK
ncbi:hypothetical protein BC826DRAFT_986688 [Russula brevipes]|nr:hypothetical protein BC826DRAFT_986688 [Russula brevipes]